MPMAAGWNARDTRHVICPRVTLKTGTGIHPMDTPAARLFLIWARSSAGPEDMDMSQSSRRFTRILIFYGLNPTGPALMLTDDIGE